VAVIGIVVAVAEIVLAVIMCVLTGMISVLAVFITDAKCGFVRSFGFKATGLRTSALRNWAAVVCVSAYFFDFLCPQRRKFCSIMQMQQTHPSMAMDLRAALTAVERRKAAFLHTSSIVL
jgi:hypothetical protein